MASFKYPCYKWSLLNGKVHEGKSRGPQCEEMLYEIHGFTQDSESWFPKISWFSCAMQLIFRMKEKYSNKDSKGSARFSHIVYKIQASLWTPQSKFIVVNRLVSMRHNFIICIFVVIIFSSYIITAICDKILAATFYA